MSETQTTDTGTGIPLTVMAGQQIIGTLILHKNTIAHVESSLPLVLVENPNSELGLENGYIDVIQISENSMWIAEILNRPENMSILISVLKAIALNDEDA